MQEDPFTEFKKVFEKFATAEQVTGAAPLGDEEEGEGVQVRLRLGSPPGCGNQAHAHGALACCVHGQPRSVHAALQTKQERVKEEATAAASDDEDDGEGTMQY
jgi:hypothetical protein